MSDNTRRAAAHPALCAACAKERTDLIAPFRALPLWRCAGCGVDGACTQFLVSTAASVEVGHVG